MSDVKMCGCYREQSGARYFCSEHGREIGERKLEIDRLRASNDSIRATADREREELMRLHAENDSLMKQLEGTRLILWLAVHDKSGAELRVSEYQVLHLRKDVMLEETQEFEEGGKVYVVRALPPRQS